MKKKWISLLLALIVAMTLLSGCGGNNTAKKDSDAITVYLWTTAVKAF